MIYLCQHVQSESTGDHSKKHLEELEEVKEEQREKELAKGELLSLKSK
jgi:hypothetical protein